MARKSVGTIRNPLEWPERHARPASPARGAFKVTLAQAVRELQESIAAMGGLYPRITFEADRMLRRKAVDQAAAVYFTVGNRELVFACAQWDRLEHNLRAIGLTLDAMRGMSRWGVSQATSQALSGFTALPKPPSWREVLGFPEGQYTSAAVVERAYREAVKRVHPDGTAPDPQQFARLQIAIQEARMHFDG